MGRTNIDPNCRYCRPDAVGATMFSVLRASGFFFSLNIVFVLVFFVLGWHVYRVIQVRQAGLSFNMRRKQKVCVFSLLVENVWLVLGHKCIVLHPNFGPTCPPVDSLWHGSWFVSGIQEGSECTKCKNDWVLRAAIALLYVLCALLTIAVAVLGYKGEFKTTKQHLDVFELTGIWIWAIPLGGGVSELQTPLVLSVSQGGLCDSTLDLDPQPSSVDKSRQVGFANILTAFLRKNETSPPNKHLG